MSGWIAWTTFASVLRRDRRGWRSNAPVATGRSRLETGGGARARAGLTASSWMTWILLDDHPIPARRGRTSGARPVRSHVPARLSTPPAVPIQSVPARSSCSDRTSSWLSPDAGGRRSNHERLHPTRGSGSTPRTVPTQTTPSASIAMISHPIVAEAARVGRIVRAADEPARCAIEAVEPAECGRPQRPAGRPRGTRARRRRRSGSAPDASRACRMIAPRYAGSRLLNPVSVPIQIRAGRSPRRGTRTRSSSRLPGIVGVVNVPRARSRRVSAIESAHDRRRACPPTARRHALMQGAHQRWPGPRLSRVRRDRARSTLMRSGARPSTPSQALRSVRIQRLPAAVLEEVPRRSRRTGSSARLSDHARNRVNRPVSRSRMATPPACVPTHSATGSVLVDVRRRCCSGMLRGSSGIVDEAR